MTKITPGTMIVLVFAVLFGLVGTFAVRRHFATAPEEVVEQPQMTVHRVPLAVTNLESGRPLTMNDIAIFAGNDEQLKQLNLTGEYMLDSRQIVGRTLRTEVKKGGAFAPDLFYPDGMGPSVAERLKPGLRAVTISIAGSGAINGLAPPTSQVDVLFRSAGGRYSSPTTVALLEDVEVLAIDRNSVAGSQGSPPLATVTLAVTSEQAKALKIADNQGTFSLALRHPDDSSLVSNTGPRTLEALLNLPEARGPFHAEIWRGQSHQSRTFPRGPKPRAEQVEMPISGLREPSVPQAIVDVSTSAVVKKEEQ